METRLTLPLSALLLTLLALLYTLAFRVARRYALADFQTLPFYQQE